MTTAGGYALLAYSEYGNLASVIFGAFALLLTMDGFTGLQVLYETMTFENENQCVVEELIDED